MELFRRISEKLSKFGRSITDSHRNLQVGAVAFIPFIIVINKLNE